MQKVQKASEGGENQREQRCCFFFLKHAFVEKLGLSATLYRHSERATATVSNSRCTFPRFPFFILPCLCWLILQDEARSVLTLARSRRIFKKRKRNPGGKYGSFEFSVCEADSRCGVALDAYVWRRHRTISYTSGTSLQTLERLLRANLDMIFASETVAGTWRWIELRSLSVVQRSTSGLDPGAAWGYVLAMLLELRVSAEKGRMGTIQLTITTLRRPRLGGATRLC